MSYYQSRKILNASKDIHLLLVIRRIAINLSPDEVETRTLEGSQTAKVSSYYRDIQE
jgi:hypothetical protein